MKELTMEKLVALCKSRGFVFPGSEIYGGFANTWDFGPVGVELKNNIKRAWWKRFVQEDPNTYGVDCAILMNPRTWEASGHVQNFGDPKMDCRNCKTRHRADTIIENHSKGSVSAEGMTNEELKKQVEEAAKILDLDKLLDRKPKALSGGQRQRVAMGRAIVRNPKVFLMDEPLSNLDAKLRVQMRIEISKIHQSLEATIIYVTHDQTEALTLGTRIVVMKDGVMQQVASPIDLYTKPCNVFVAGFIGSPQMNFIDCKAVKSGNDVKLEFGSYSVKIPENKANKIIEGGYIGKDLILGIRPEDIKDEEIFINSGTDNVLEATVKVYEMLGAEVFLYFTVEGHDVTVRVNPRTTARPGDTIKIALDVSKIHVFDKETEKTITN